MFKLEFLDTKPHWPGRRFSLKRYPISKGKEVTFWHFIQEGKIEEERTPCMDRCARIKWPRQLIDSFPNRKPIETDNIVWWKNKRKQENNYLIALLDFSYLVVIADRKDYVFPRTAYCVTRAHQRRKLEKEFISYWRENG